MSAAETIADRLHQFGLWPARVMWFLLPLVWGQGLRDALTDASVGYQTLAELVTWIVWFVGFVALLAPSTVALTVVRTLAPVVPVAAMTAGVFGGFAATTIGAVFYGLVGSVVVFAPTTGDPMINGSSYGPERRFALRPPAAALAGALPVSWLMWAVATFTGPIIIASGRLLLGVAVTIVGAAVAWRLLGSFHQLSRRWVVFVPAGFVLHDYWSMAESILVQRRTQPRLGPASKSINDPVDISAGARGLALAVQFSDPIPMAVKEGRNVHARTATAAIFSPTLPGKVLQEARARGITIAAD